jgi:hypothetical protein
MAGNSEGTLGMSFEATEISRTPDKQGSILQPATMLCGHSYLSNTGWIRTVLYFFCNLETKVGLAVIHTSKMH